MTAQEREHWFFQHLRHSLAANFRASIARTPFCAILLRSPNSHSGQKLRIEICALLKIPVKQENTTKKQGNPQLEKNTKETKTPRKRRTGDHYLSASQKPSNKIRWFQNECECRALREVPYATGSSSSSSLDNCLTLQKCDVDSTSAGGCCPFLTTQRQRYIKFRVLSAQDVYIPLALNCRKGQHLPALEVYKNQSPKKAHARGVYKPGVFSVGILQKGNMKTKEQISGCKAV